MSAPAGNSITRWLQMRLFPSRYKSVQKPERGARSHFQRNPPNNLSHRARRGYQGTPSTPKILRNTYAGHHSKRRCQDPSRAVTLVLCRLSRKYWWTWSRRRYYRFKKASLNIFHAFHSRSVISSISKIPRRVLKVKDARNAWFIEDISISG